MGFVHDPHSTAKRLNTTLYRETAKHDTLKTQETQKEHHRHKKHERNTTDTRNTKGTPQIM